MYTNSSRNMKTLHRVHNTYLLRSKNILLYLSEFALSRIHDTYVENQLVGVVVVENTIQVVAETRSDLLGNLLHC